MENNYKKCKKCKRCKKCKDNSSQSLYFSDFFQPVSVAPGALGFPRFIGLGITSFGDNLQAFDRSSYTVHDKIRIRSMGVSIKWDEIVEFTGKFTIIVTLYVRNRVGLIYEANFIVTPVTVTLNFEEVTQSSYFDIETNYTIEAGSLISIQCNSFNETDKDLSNNISVVLSTKSPVFISNIVNGSVLIKKRI